MTSARFNDLYGGVEGVEAALYFAVVEMKGGPLYPTSVSELFAVVSTVDVEALTKELLAKHDWLTANGDIQVSATREAWIAHAVTLAGQDEVYRWLLKWEEG